MSLPPVRVKLEPHERMMESLMISVEERDVKVGDSIDTTLIIKSTVEAKPEPGLDSTPTEEMVVTGNSEVGQESPIEFRDWEEVKQWIEWYYLVERRSLPDTMQVMRERYGFVASSVSLRLEYL